MPSVILLGHSDLHVDQDGTKLGSVRLYLPTVVVNQIGSAREFQISSLRLKWMALVCLSAILPSDLAL